MIGVRLKLARRAAGLSLRGLADAIDGRVTAQAIGRYERNEAMPGSAVLIALAVALDASVDYLLGDPQLVLEDLAFRKNAFATRRSEAQVEAAVLARLERYLAIEDILGLSSLDWNKSRDVPYPVFRDLTDAERGADALRMHWGLGIDPVSNLVELLEEQGVKVFAVPLDNIGGLAAIARRSGRGDVPVVVVNQNDGGERQRFTIAHEVGHMVLAVSPRIDREKAAHRFAGAFVMPAEALWHEVGKRRKSVSIGELLELKRLFGVSVQALTCRCRDLGIFSQALYDRLFDAFKRAGWRTPPCEEPNPVTRERPRRFERLCLRALAEGAISHARAAELLDASLRDVEEYMRGTVPLPGAAV